MTLSKKNSVLTVIVAITLSVIVYSTGVFDIQEADALCGKTCRAAKAKGMTIQEYLNQGKTNTVNQKNLIDKISGKNFISIRVSESCKHIDYCPSIDDLAKAYDNSNRYISGDFYFDEAKQEWARSPPIIYNSFELYKFMDNQEWHLWVDPDDYTWKRTKQIQIVPHLNYVLSNDIIEQQTRTEYRGLYLEGDCHKAIIGWKDNGENILLDVLNSFYSDCATAVSYDPTVEIFMGSKIFPECDRECFWYKEQMKRADKAYYQTQKEFEDSYAGKESTKSSEKKCYGIYCDQEDDDVDIPDERPKTPEEKIEEAELKEKRRAERLQELEDIQYCEKLKRADPIDRRAEKVDCQDEDEREEYMKEMEEEFPDGVDGVPKYR